MVFDDVQNLRLWIETRVYIEWEQTASFIICLLFHLVRIWFFSQGDLKFLQSLSSLNNECQNTVTRMIWLKRKQTSKQEKDDRRKAKKEGGGEGGKKGRKKAWIIVFFYFKKIYFNWRLISLQYCGGFCHTFTWISHGCICVKTHFQDDTFRECLEGTILT